jgi:transposase-like protein
MRKRYTSEQRSELISLVNGEGATVSEAAARLGVTASTAYLWVKRATNARPRGPRAAGRQRSGGALSSVPPTFMQLVRAEDLAATIAVRVGGAEIQVRHGFDAGLLRAVAEALRGGTS